MNILALIFITLAIASNVSNAAYLRIIEADVSDGKWGHGPVLSGDMNLCPSALFSKFTVECVSENSGFPGPTYAKFYVNGEFTRKESVQPYVLTGDVDQTAKPWLMYPHIASIECKLSNGEETKATVNFDCGTGSPVMAPPSSPIPDTSMMSRSGSSLENEPDVCLKIPTTEYDFMSGPWERQGSAMAYKSTETSRSTDRSGTSKLLYNFVAPETSRYAFTLDWETAGYTDHNDVWVDFPAGGWTLERRDSIKHLKGWIKAYQNEKKRETAAYSVDFNPHAISTTKVLKKGQAYVVKIGGRSTRVKVFNIIMFPCEGEECFYGSYWKNGIAKCSGKEKGV